MQHTSENALAGRRLGAVGDDVGQRLQAVEINTPQSMVA